MVACSAGIGRGMQRGASVQGQEANRRLLRGGARSGFPLGGGQENGPTGRPQGAGRTVGPLWRYNGCGYAAGKALLEEAPGTA